MLPPVAGIKDSHVMLPQSAVAVGKSIADELAASVGEVPETVNAADCLA